MQKSQSDANLSNVTVFPRSLNQPALIQFLFPSSKVMKKLILEPADRLSSLQTLWENNKPADPGPCGKSPCTPTSVHFNCSASCLLFINPLCCVFPLRSGGFSQMYRCVCDWLGLPYKEEVQWVSGFSGSILLFIFAHYVLFMQCLCTVCAKIKKSIIEKKRMKKMKDLL